ncbi:hypothetical protein DRP44_07645 [candidate division TA06 bacterium]|uniref:Uncharacterized protein n=1 Tax=candidate division TA06 bacterium TaxID=2250710 RepID=A0A660S5J9_UNCT6|nr:MAG: hypothetical protein DRP44_07645 [candidate division TA06 bacterium]
MSTNIWIWIAALLTLAIYSFLYKDNIVYKIAEYLLVGVSIGYSIAITWYNVVIAKMVVPIRDQHNFLIIIPILIGMFMFARFSKKHGWLSKIPISFVIGWGAGVAIPLQFETSIVEHVKNTIAIPWFGGNILLLVNAIIIFIGVIATLIYFYFSTPHKGVIGKVANLGIWYIMIAFGASFGYTVMARISLFIDRAQFLLHDWLGLIH